MSEDSAHIESRDCREIIENKTRGKLVFDGGSITRRPLRFLKILGPLFLSHHPDCTQYEHHVVSIKNRKYCIGCFFNTLFFMLSLAILLSIWLIAPSLFNRTWLLYGGVMGLILYLLIGLLRFSESRRRKVATKFVLGTSFSMIFFLIATAGGSIEFLIEAKTILIFLLYFGVFTFLLAKRAWEFLKTCEACEYKMRWSKCPGFIDTICELIDEKFVVAKEIEHDHEGT